LNTVWRSYSLIERSWGAESIVFNPASGNTHLLKPIAAKILALLREQPSSATALSERLAAEMQVESDAEILQRVEIVLRTLDDLGLVEPTSR
jgi:PqqD family protein of HPr-rel-A system